jgi:hypothetical protein
VAPRPASLGGLVRDQGPPTRSACCRWFSPPSTASTSAASNPTYDPNNYYCSLLARAPTGPLEPPTTQPLLNLAQFNVSGRRLPGRLARRPRRTGRARRRPRPDQHPHRLQLSRQVRDPGSCRARPCTTTPARSAHRSRAGRASPTPTWKAITTFGYERGPGQHRLHLALHRQDGPHERVSPRRPQRRLASRPTTSST